MSYARFGEDSECYIIKSIGDEYQCLGCRITGEPSSNGVRYGFWYTKDPKKMLTHLHMHRYLGFKVPNYAFKRLKKEVDQ